MNNTYVYLLSAHIQLHEVAKLALSFTQMNSERLTFTNVNITIYCTRIDRQTKLQNQIQNSLTKQLDRYKIHCFLIHPSSTQNSPQRKKRETAGGPLHPGPLPLSRTRRAEMNRVFPAQNSWTPCARGASTNYYRVVAHYATLTLFVRVWTLFVF